MTSFPVQQADGRLPIETIHQVMAANPIAELIGSYLPLKKTGSTFLALCPRHQEKTPSFNVNPARGTFKCFGCGVHGSVFDFVMLQEGITFLPAVRRLATRAGIPIAGGEAPAGEAAKRKQKPKLVIKRPEPLPFRLPDDLHRGTAGELRLVAERRSLSLDGVSLASGRGLLRFGSPRGCPSWIVTDAAGVNAQARRMDGGLWEHIGRKKAYTLPGSRAAWPIGARETDAFPCVVLVAPLPHFQFMTIIVDTREPGEGTNHPWASYWPADVRVTRGTLETGDVALAALPEGAVVERKTVPDFLAAIGRERERFDREIKRARYLGSFTILVEGTFADVLQANRQRGQLSDAAIFGTVASWTRRGAPVLFAGTVHAAADLAYRILAGQVREIERASKALTKAEAVTQG